MRPPIVVNAGVLGERPTGVGVYASHVIDGLARLGERLTVYTSAPEGLTAPGIEVRTISGAVRPERGTRGHLARLAWTQTGLRRAVRREGALALLNLMPEGVLWPAAPQVATVHDLFPLHFPEEYPRLRHYFRTWVPLVLRHSRAVVTISQASRDDLVRFYRVPAERIFVALCGYDRSRFTPAGAGAAGGEPYALYVGNVMPHKNLLRLVEAFAMATRRQPARLVIRGRGPAAHVEAVRARIDALGLGPRTDWQPYAPADELAALYRGARLLVLPSLAEGFGLTALEAMACGTPVVAADRSSLPEVVGDAGLLVDPLDVGQLADAIGRLLADDRLHSDLRARGLARCPRFSWEDTARVVQQALRAAV